MINSRLAKQKNPAGSGGFGTAAHFGGPGRPPAGIVTQQEKIGAHNITVTRVVDRKGFISWVEDRLRKTASDNPAIPEAMKDVVAEYLKGRYRWFVFDVVELGDTLKTKDAIQYRFRSQSLYYPMRITRAGEGNTLVQLLFFSHKRHHVPSGGGLHVKALNQPIQVSRRELRELGNHDIAELLKGQECLLRIWEVRGPLSGFTRDIVTQ